MAFTDEFVVADRKQHDLKKFSCGKPEMDQFLARFSVKNIELGLSRTWVLPVISNDSEGTKAPVVAYYTLASATVTRQEIPTDKSRLDYPVPVVLLARLAVAEAFKGQRLGEKTLITALRKTVELTHGGLPALGLALDVLDEDALGFYQHFGIFEPFLDDPVRLFSPMHLLQQI
ncbi:MAG: GNAT family N-acetyltransferase [Sedimenticola sp.]